MRTKVWKYLGYQNQVIPLEMENLVEDCIREVKEYAHFKAVYQRHPLCHEPLSIAALALDLDYKALHHLLDQCAECILIACSLGIILEQRIKYYAKFDQTRMIVLDAAASAYVEERCSQFEQSLNLEQRTFRFCPGYEQTPLSMNRHIAKVLDIYKYLGVELTEGDLMIPQKSMIGIIGIGISPHRKNCNTCIKMDDCLFRKKGQRCYKID